VAACNISKRIKRLSKKVVTISDNKREGWEVTKVYSSTSFFNFQP